MSWYSTISKFVFLKIHYVRNIGIKLAIIFLSLTYACKSKPNNILSEDKMVEILADQKMLESRVDHFYLGGMDSSRVAYQYLHKQLLEKHQTDSATFARSYDYYLDNKKAMLKIIDKSIELLKERNEIEAPNLDDKVVHE